MVAFREQAKRRKRAPRVERPAPAPSPNGPIGEGRDKSTGRFLPGNPGGPGNPFARKVARLRSALLEAVTETDVAAVGRKLVSLALEGDTAAAKLVLDYLLGGPAPAVNPDRVADDEAQDLLLREIQRKLLPS